MACKHRADALQVPLCWLLAAQNQRVSRLVLLLPLDQLPASCHRCPAALQSQLTLDSFMASSQRVAKIKSKRLQKVRGPVGVEGLQGLRGRRVGGSWARRCRIA